jgi:hypothetical protein
VGEIVSLTTTPYKEYLFVNWTEDDEQVCESETYSFTVEEDRSLVANLIIRLCKVNVDVNIPEYGYAIGGGVYVAYSDVTVEAFVDECYRFSNWTVDNTEVSKDSRYEFTAIDSVNLVANFYALDFDTYSPTLWDNTFMLNLRRLQEEGYNYFGCKWFKNGIEEKDTRTVNQFSYSAGPYETDLLELSPTFYMFVLETNNLGNLCSSKKIIENYLSNSSLLAYPNPMLAGGRITIEGFAKNSPISIYNQFGACVEKTIATEHLVTLTLDYPPGIYLIRSNNKIVKILIVK